MFLFSIAFFMGTAEHGNRRTDEQGVVNAEVPEHGNIQYRTRLGAKRKKENGFSFYALHQNQLLSEVLFSTAGLFLKPSLCSA